MEKHVEKDIYGNYTHKAIGFCNCKWHSGAITKDIACKHHCKVKQCHYLEKYDSSYWDTRRKRRKNKHKSKKGEEINGL